MYAEERHRTIVNLALRYDRVSVADLASRFDVTTETIRRDLDALDKRGILRRVHGGAVIEENSISSVKIPFVLRELEQGDAAFLSAADAGVTAAGEGQAFLASPGAV